MSIRLASMVLMLVLVGCQSVHRGGGSGRDGGPQLGHDATTPFDDGSAHSLDGSVATDGAAPAGDAGLPSTCSTSIDRDQTLNFDVRSVHLTGLVTVNGRTIGADDPMAGSLLFQPKFTGASTATSTLASAGRYDTRLVPGTYDVYWSVGGLTCDAQSGRQRLPCVDARLAENVAIEVDRTLDIDVHSIVVSGNLALNGGDFPEVSPYYDRGTLQFELQQADVAPYFIAGVGLNALTGTTAPLAPKGSTSYSFIAVPGTYNIRYVPHATFCKSGANTAGVPCTSGLLQQDVALDSTATLNLEAQVVIGSIAVRSAKAVRVLRTACCLVVATSNHA